MLLQPDSPNETALRPFYFGPVRFLTDFDFPELEGAEGSALFTATVRFGSVAAELHDAVRPQTWLQLRDGCYQVEVPSVGRFRVENGCSVTVDPEPGAAGSDVRFYLLAWVFGALAHQNGLLPLHACSVAHGESVTAFFGQSGAGKSTLAAALRARGHAIASDDICLCEPMPEAARVHPLAHWIKLWRESLDELTPETGDEQPVRVLTGLEKFRVKLTAVPAGPLFLRQLVLLVPDESADAVPRLEPMSASETVAGMMRTTYLNYVVEALGGQVALFQLCARAMAGAKGYRLTVPRDFRKLPATLELVERELLGLGRG